MGIEWNLCKDSCTQFERERDEATTRVDAMAPVVEAARAWYANGVDPDGKFAKALSDAVEDYEHETQRFEGVA